MSINLTDEIEVKTKKGKLGAAKQIFLEGDTQTVEEEIQHINSRHNTLNTKHESLSRTVQGIAATGGASTANNVTYNNNSSGLNAENVQDAIDELQNSKIDKTSILQEFGEADDKVISQKTISNKINNLLSNISEIDEIVNTAISDISTLKKKVDDIPATIPKVVSMSESDYDDLETKEPNTYYMLMEEQPMIKLGNKEISAIRLGSNVISAVYKGSVLIWQAIRSCFGSGWWVNEKPWINDETWKN